MSKQKHPRASSAQRGYSYRWQVARKQYLTEHPLCVLCEKAGQLTAATVVDHIQPHKGDETLFWDVNNWQSLCTQHHNSTKQSIERLGYEKGCDADGIPLDSDHHWNQL